MFRLLLLLLLSGCASTFVKSYDGKTARDLEADLGVPVEIIEHGYNLRTYQYYWGGGTVAMPGYSVTNYVGFGSNTTAYTTHFPDEVYYSEGCLVDFVTEKHGDNWVIVGGRWPDRLVC